MLRVVISILLVGISLVSFRVYSILPAANRKRFTRQNTDGSNKCRTAVFLGSGQSKFPQHHEYPCFDYVTGGHTSEALTLISALDFSRYTPRIYIISEGDSLSAEKAAALESQKSSSNKVCHCITYVHLPNGSNIRRENTSS
jgi:beta-1,4-N-acetylglucosaminyltransferase